MARRNRPLTRLVVAALAIAFAALVALVRALRRSAERARGVPLSPLTAGWRVGADYPERRGIVSEARSASERRGGSDDPRDADGEIAGEMDDVSEYAGPAFDPDAVAPSVRSFYERTADYRLAYDVRWHRPFRLGAALASAATSRLRQLNLPGPGESGPSGDSRVRELDGRFACVDPDADPREGARAWVRTNVAGEAVFVAIYAHHERDGTTYVNVAVPLPGANLSTVLRPQNLGDGIELTTLDADGDEGLFLVTPLGALSLPLDQRFRVCPASAGFPGTDPFNDVDGDEAAIVATHEMWLFGRKFLTIRYAGRENPSE
ncbi:hypothetical protein [Halorussus aquaticus]|uniref:Uncharacterized protein n=1 Tax=Halorussus aquaticus TaxID=2953748 RepID=A0ABD5Q2M6_9EURY|nr:hypothetical protein [Halorussus aquaticus]